MKKFILGVMVFMLLLMTGCTVTDYDDENYDNPYSRESVCGSEPLLFGTGRTEDIDIALRYLYTCDELSDIYGDTFEITGDEIICYKSEGQSFFLLGIYKGEADYGFRFEDGIYRIKLNKGYFGRWTVISAGWQDPEEEEYNSGLYQY